MDNRTSEKICNCTISVRDANCTGDHARNLSDAARYMLNSGDIVENPPRARVSARNRSFVDEPLEFIDPPLPERRYVRNEPTGERISRIETQSNPRRRHDESSFPDDHPLPLRDIAGRELISPGGNLVEDSRFRAINRNPLSKFESLRIGESSLRDVSIGGFKIDVEAAASKASEVIPLPPARLPIIFANEDLNFYHHFFNGIYEIISYDDLMDIINSEPSDGFASSFVVNTVEDLLALGYEKSDTEAMNLIKRMLQSTFRIETTRNRSARERSSCLFVEANLWGFPYLESTMTCQEIDMRYWLQACYKMYETAWFNTFKSTKVPVFARCVLKRSRGSSSSSKPSLNSISEVSDHEIADMLRDDVSVISKVSNRRGKTRRKSSSNSNDKRSTHGWFN